MPDSTKCGQCNLAIEDQESDSIECDVCGRWVHATRECSKLKKSIFKLIRENDPWVCPKCIELCKKNNDIVNELRKELKEVRDLNFIMHEENKSLIKRLKSLELELANLKQKPICELQDIPNCHVNSITPSTHCSPPAAGTDTTGTLVSSVPLTLSKTQPTPSLRLVGDSHVRNLRPLLQKEHETKHINLNVRADFYPNAPMNVYTKSLAFELQHQVELNPTVTSNSCSVLMGGVNDTSETVVDETMDLLDSNASLFNTTKLVIVETPYRYDNINLNKAIAEQNKKLSNICSRYGWTFIPINFALYRMHYTTQGLHLNHRGKKLLSRLIFNALTAASSRTYSFLDQKPVLT
jgi:hypothetical protein